MTNNKQTTTSRFAEILGGLLYELLKASGMSMMPVKAHEKIRSIGEKLAKTIEHHAEKKAIEVIKRLQKAVITSFDRVEDDLNEQRKELERLRIEVQESRQQVAELERTMSMSNPRIK